MQTEPAFLYAICAPRVHLKVKDLERDPDLAPRPVVVRIKPEYIEISELRESELNEENIQSAGKNSDTLPEFVDLFNARLEPSVLLEKGKFEYKWTWTRELYFRADAHGDYAALSFQETLGRTVPGTFRAGKKAKQLFKQLGY